MIKEKLSQMGLLEDYWTLNKAQYFLLVIGLILINVAFVVLFMMEGI